jgi:hypothetical protein
MRAAHGADDIDSDISSLGFRPSSRRSLAPPNESLVNLIHCLVVILILVADVDFLVTAESFFLVLDPSERVDQAPAHRSPDYTDKNPTQLVTDPFS